MSNQKPFRASNYKPTSYKPTNMPNFNPTGIFSSIAGIGQSLLQRGTDKRNIAAQTKANKELAQYSYQMDLEQYNRANTYNNPTSNMARLREAGLNPNLVYGTGSATQLAAEGPKYNQQVADQAITAPNIGNPINELQQYRQGEANIALTNQHASTSGATQAKIEAETPFIKTSEGRKVEQHTQDLKNKQAINANSVQQLKNAKLDGKMKTMQNEIKNATKKFEKEGVTPKDLMWINAIDKILKKFNFSLFDWLNPTGQKPDNVSLNSN